MVCRQKTDQLINDQKKQEVDSFLMDDDTFDDHDFLSFTCPTCVYSHITREINGWKLEAVKGYLANNKEQMSDGHS